MNFHRTRLAPLLIGLWLALFSRGAFAALEAESPAFVLDTLTPYSTASAESAAFELNTLTPGAMSAAVSASFVLNTRMPGGSSGSRDSGSFVLDTRSVAATQLIVQAPANVGGGTAVDLSARVFFSDGTSDDVSERATWTLTGGPAGTRMAGRTLIATYSATATPASVQASYLARSGRLLSSAAQVTIGPALNVRLLNPRAVSNGASSWTITANAVVTGGVGFGSVQWRWRGNTLPGQITTALSAAVPGPSGRGQLDVTISDAQGKVGTALADLSLDNAPVVNQPLRIVSTRDKGPALLYGSDGVSGVNLRSARKSAGLLVVVHGMNDSVSSGWMSRMAQAIETKLAATVKGPPNILLYDWNQSADPSRQSGYDDRTAQEQQMLKELGIWRYAFSLAPEAHPAITEKGKLVRDIVSVRPAARSHGAILADWIDAKIASGEVATDASIHLIGHSAGGFVVAECATQLLKPHNPARSFSDLLVTTLDTPMLPRDEVTGVKDHGARLERYNSWVGRFSPGLIGINDRYTVYPLLFVPTTAPLTVPQYSLPTVIYDRNYRIGEATSTGRRMDGWYSQHNEAYEWYIDSVTKAESWKDGFFFSPFLGNRWSSGAGGASSASAEGAMAPRQVSLAAAILPDQPLTGFSTFGSVSQQGAQFTITENADAGIFKTLPVPVGATELKFRVRFDQIGDGDFLEISFGDHDPLAEIDGLPNMAGRWIDFELPMRSFTGESGLLMFRLVSRGASNAVVTLDSVAFAMSDDPDEDGLTTAQESALGTDPTAFDSDGDGFGDGYEVTVTHTDPRMYDSDGDGVDDYSEIAAGSDPMDARSVLATRGVTAGAGGFAIRWASVRGRSYRVVRSAEPGFASLDVIAAGLVATGPASSFTDLAASGLLTAFYRVELEQSSAAPDDDPDRDGLTTAEELALGTDPGRYDTDHDGISDGEEVNVLRTNPLRADTDGDGASDFAELLAGTDPTNPASLLAIKSLARNADGSVTLRWNGVAGRTYTVLRSLTPDFSNPATIRTSWPGLPPITTFTDNTAGAASSGALFYKIVVE